MKSAYDECKFLGESIKRSVQVTLYLWSVMSTDIATTQYWFSLQSLLADSILYQALLEESDYAMYVCT